MTSRTLLLISFVFLLSGCFARKDTCPEIIRTSERLMERGVDAHASGDYVNAIEHFTLALARYRSIDHRQGMLFSHLNLAETTLASNRLDAAVRHIDEADVLSLELSHHDIIQRVALLKARQYWSQQQSCKALLQLEGLLPTFDARDHSESMPDKLQLAALSLRTDIAFASLQENPEEAELWLQRLQQAIQMAQPVDPRHYARQQRFEARLAAWKNQPDLALSLLDEALATYRRKALRPAIAATLVEAAQINWMSHSLDHAEQLLQRALFIRVWMMDRNNAREILEMLSELYKQMGDEARASQSQHLSEAIIDHDEEWQLLMQKIKPQ